MTGRVRRVGRQARRLLPERRVQIVVEVAALAAAVVGVRELTGSAGWTWVAAAVALGGLAFMLHPGEG